MRLGGYNSMAQQNEPVSMDSRTPGHWREGNPVPEATAIIGEKFKGSQKIFGLKRRTPVSRDISLPQSTDTLNIWFKIQLKRHLSAAKL